MRARVYWIHGCGNCVRVRGFLRDRGCEFDEVDVQSATGDLAMLRDVGIPAVQLGDRVVSGIDLPAVATLLGIAPPGGELLPVGTLAARASRFVLAAARSLGQLPAERLDDPIPGMPTDLRAAIHRADGTPYLPHRTNRELVSHLIGHAAKFVAFARHPNPAFAAHQGEFSAFGEPGGCSAEALTDLLHRMAERVRGCTVVAAPGPIDTFFGPRSRHDLLQTMTVALGQHSRQLADVVHRGGAVPTGTPAPADLAGLTLPAALWA